MYDGFCNRIGLFRLPSVILVDSLGSDSLRLASRQLTPAKSSKMHMGFDKVGRQ